MLADMGNAYPTIRWPCAWHTVIADARYAQKDLAKRFRMKNGDGGQHVKA